MADMTCLADGLVVPADMNITGLNLNELIVGATGCGKSMSNAYSRLLYTNDSSVVVPISKKAILNKFKLLFENRGYKVEVLNMANPSESTVGYDPLDFVHSREDVMALARNLIGCGDSRDRQGEIDPYWNNSASSVLAAEIELIRLNAKEAGLSPCFADVIKLNNSIETIGDGGHFKSNVDYLFEKAELYTPGNAATIHWKSISGLAMKTASCILQMVNNALGRIFSPEVTALSKLKERVDFHKLGSKKTVLFIVTSPINRALSTYVNIIYADMFRTLFEVAEEKDTGRLDIPVHIICDDFACTGKIDNFENYISIFRAAGISVTMLLQSESQLAGMYGDNGATTIINNCDTYVYMGGMDLKTCENIAKRINKPISYTLDMPLEKVLVFRRGNKPFEGKRYQILEDEKYKELEKLNRENEEQLKQISERC